MNFIEKANLRHNFKYDYSLVEYKGIDYYVKIICPIHGEFLQTPKNHNRTNGCRKCSLTRKLDNEFFIEKANLRHNFKYDYSLVQCINNKTKVIISCREHGEFNQTPNGHLTGNGCPVCKKTTISKLKKLDTNKVITKFIKKHKNQYDYSLVNYIDYEEYVSVICEYHGVFKISPHDHISGTGCRKCADDKRRKNVLTFIDDANKIHFYRYDYSMVNYINNKTKVKIICKEHGIFEQNPNAHIHDKNGCPKCKISKGEFIVFNWLKHNGINFEYQKVLKGCFYKNSLIFDFYLAELNICIEVDGIQHFKPIEFFGGQDAFDKQIIKDSIKNKYCEDNNIDLIRIKEIGNINDVLNKFIFNI